MEVVKVVDIFKVVFSSRVGGGGCAGCAAAHPLFGCRSDIFYPKFAQEVSKSRVEAIILAKNAVQRSSFFGDFQKRLEKVKNYVYTAILSSQIWQKNVLAVLSSEKLASQGRVLSKTNQLSACIQIPWGNIDSNF